MPNRRKFTVRVEVLPPYDVEISADEPDAAESQVLAMEAESLAESGTLVSEGTQCAGVVEEEDSDEDDGFLPYPLD